MKERVVRAQFDDSTLIVYEAYGDVIAGSSIKNGTFVSPPFKMERMTWIKPSFLWMMYRSGWATKKGQENVLAIKIKRSGLDWALKNSCLSHFDPELHSSYDEWKASVSRLPSAFNVDRSGIFDYNP